LTLDPGWAVVAVIMTRQLGNLTDKQLSRKMPEMSTEKPSTSGVTSSGATDGPWPQPDGSRPGGFQSLAAQTLSHQVAQALVASIVLGQFQPGDSLPAAGDLAREFKVSRPVVREALKEVSTLGMVESRQGRYTRVADRSAWNDLSPDLLSVRLAVGAVDDIIVDSLELRRVIETEAAALAAQRATDDDLAAMRETLEVLARELDDTPAYVAHDVAFHDAILRATNNRLFLRLLDQMRELLVLARTVSATARSDRRPESQAGHRAIFAAIERHDPEAARLAMADHLSWAESVNVGDYRASHLGSAGAAAGPAVTAPGGGFARQAGR
jgi:DNA-binding FadR family transcriptional regulator